MAKVITLSRTFPAYHPKAGQPTYFVEQVLDALGIEFYDLDYLDLLHELNPNKSSIVWDFFSDLQVFNYDFTRQKLHTIRAGHRWKQGNKASLRVWSGKPYNSPQIIIAPDVEIKTAVFEKRLTSHSGMAPFINGWLINPDILCDVAENDGLDKADLLAWFKWSDPKPFDGQILCWKEVDYV